MKTMKLITTSVLYLGIMALLVCCENPTPDNSYEMKVVDSLDAQRSNENTATNHTYSDTLTQATNRADTTAGDTVDRTQLYQDLGMTEDEIQRFEDDFNRKVNAIKTHGRGDYTAQDIENQEGQSMNAVLSKEQYKKYLAWKESRSSQKN